MRTKLIILTLLISISAVAQDSKWYIGVGGGYHNSKFRFSELDEKVFQENTRLGSGVFSVFGQYEFGKDFNWVVRPEISFLKRGGGLERIYTDCNGTDCGDNLQYRIKANYYDFRVPFMYQFNYYDSKFRPYVYVAPVLGFVSGGNINMHNDSPDNTYYGYNLEMTKANYASAYFAGSVGIGSKCQFKINDQIYFLALEASYELGFTNTYSKKERRGESIVDENSFFQSNAYNLKGTRKLSGFEIKATLGIPLSVFKKKERTPAVKEVYKPVPVVIKREEPKPIPVVQAVKEDRCYSLEEIIELMDKGERIEGKTICAIDAISFDFGKSNIKAESHDYLDNLAKTLIRTNAKIEVKGHTDNVGSEQYNMNLSRDRAKAVMEYLISKGVDKEKLTYSYYGMSKPLATNDTEEGRIINRRVEFEILR